MCMNWSYEIPVEGSHMDFVPLANYELHLAICQVLRDLPSDIIRHEIWPEATRVPKAPAAPPRRLGRVTRKLRDRGRNAQSATI
jgi:hypothetical protein